MMKNASDEECDIELNVDVYDVLQPIDHAITNPIDTVEFNVVKSATTKRLMDKYVNCKIDNLKNASVVDNPCTDEESINESNLDVDTVLPPKDCAVTNPIGSDFFGTEKNDEIGINKKLINPVFNIDQAMDVEITKEDIELTSSSPETRQKFVCSTPLVTNSNKFPIFNCRDSVINAIDYNVQDNDYSIICDAGEAFEVNKERTHANIIESEKDDNDFHQILSEFDGNILRPSQVLQNRNSQMRQSQTPSEVQSHQLLEAEELTKHTTPPCNIDIIDLNVLCLSQHNVGLSPQSSRNSQDNQNKENDAPISNIVDIVINKLTQEPRDAQQNIMTELDKSVLPNQKTDTDDGSYVNRRETVSHISPHIIQNIQDKSPTKTQDPSTYNVNLFDSQEYTFSDNGNDDEPATLNDDIGKTIPKRRRSEMSQTEDNIESQPPTKRTRLAVEPKIVDCADDKKNNPTSPKQHTLFRKPSVGDVDLDHESTAIDRMDIGVDTAITEPSRDDCLSSLSDSNVVVDIKEHIVPNKEHQPETLENAVVVMESVEENKHKSITMVKKRKREDSLSSLSSEDAAPVVVKVAQMRRKTTDRRSRVKPKIEYRVLFGNLRVDLERYLLLHPGWLIWPPNIFSRPPLNQFGRRELTEALSNVGEEIPILEPSHDEKKQLNVLMLAFLCSMSRRKLLVEGYHVARRCKVFVKVAKLPAEELQLHRVTHEDLRDSLWANSPIRSPELMRKICAEAAPSATKKILEQEMAYVYMVQIILNKQQNNSSTQQNDENSQSTHS